MLDLLQIWVLSVIGLGEAVTIAILIFIFTQMTALYIVNNKAAENEQRLAVENTALAQRNKLKEKFLQNFSHEMKTPLTIISSHSQLTLLRAQSPNAADEYTAEKMKLVASEAERAALMVNQLLEFANKENPNIEYSFAETDVLALIKNTADRYYPVLNKNHNKLIIDLPNTLPAVWADEARITQVLVNLISNAVKFTKNGTITLGARSTDGGVEFFVEDTGKGMNEYEFKRIFERFYTSEKEVNSGIGLGLHISSEIIKAHGSRIKANSAPDKGTRFYFELKTIPETGGEPLESKTDCTSD